MAARREARALSPNHQAVFDTLKRAAHPMTAYEILDAVRSQGITAPPTVYRALNRLIAQGRVHRIESLNAYLACCETHAHEGPVVFAICEDCGEAAEFSDARLAALLSARAKGRDFRVESAMLELRGHCGCREGGKGGE